MAIGATTLRSVDRLPSHLHHAIIALAVCLVSECSLVTDDPLFSVANQVVLVSGGSRGIGQAIAGGFAARGAQVVITGRDAKTLQATADALSEHGGRVQPIVCDVAKRAHIERLVDQLLAEMGRVDTLVNVAGVNRRKPATEITEDDYDFVLDINLKGAFLLSQAIGRHMLDRQSGCQIQIASLNTDRPLKNVLPYAMSKSALGQMTRGLALEWGPRGVRVNAIAPGFILTDLTRGLWSDANIRAWGQANTPLRRLGQPDDLIGASLFLASPAAAFLTGQILYVDGGFTAGWAWPIPE
jgi:NAD(P)-dependent dehydrogenase (short-subunit alcohol dehydrogenase family)